MVDIPNKDKAAVFLHSMKPRVAEAVLQILGKKHAAELREIMQIYARMPDIDELIQNVLAEFEQLSRGEIDLTLDLLGIGQNREDGDSQVVGPFGTGGHGGYSVDAGDKASAMQSVLSASSEASSGTMVDGLDYGDDPVVELQLMDLDSLSAAVRREHPSAVGIVLNSMEPERASKLLALMPPEKRRQIFTHMAGGIPDSPDLNRRVIGTIIESARRIGPDSVERSEAEELGRLGEVLQSVDPAEREDWLNAIKERDAEKADVLEKSLWKFEDVLNLDNRSLQRLLAKADIKVLAFALADAPAEIMKHVEKNSSERNRGHLAEEIEYLGRVSKIQVDEAQRAITDLMRSMDKEGALHRIR